MRHPHRLQFLIGVAVFALVVTSCGDDGDDQPDPTTVPPGTDTTTTTTTEPDDEAAWVSCENPEVGYTVSHPPDWQTNAGDILAPCSAFDPEPIELEPDTDIPVDIAVVIQAEPADFATLQEGSLGDDIITTQDETVDGRDAVRLEVESTGEGMYPQGMEMTRWVVDLEEGVLVARATDVGEPDYANKQDVLDEMMTTLSLEPVDPPDPADPPDPPEPPEDEGPDPVGEFQTGEIATPGFPSLEAAPIQLVDVRVASHDGFDRVVLEFEGPAPPSWRVTYVDPPITEDGSGNPIDVAGNAFLEMRLTPASGVDLSGPDIVETYTGPNRLDAPGPVAQEVVRAGDFEANLAWVVGVTDTAPFAAVFLEDPLRLVVDIAVP